MRSVSSILALTLVLGWLLPQPGAADDIEARPSFAEPAVSPDHREIAFVSGGDIWSVASTGGFARILVATGGTASRPIFAPDGKRLAFVSTRPGAIGIEVVGIDGGGLTRVTHSDVVPELDGWSNDGRFIYFSSSADNIGYAGDIMRVSATGGTPMRVIDDRFVNATDGALAPDGHALAYVRNGFPQWWRRGHSHIDQSEIVVADSAAQHVSELTGGEARDRWPMWSPDGSTVYYVSDRSGSDELWSAREGRRSRLTTLAGEPLLWPTISRDGQLIAFERASDIWTYDVASRTAARIPITLRGETVTPTVTHVVQSSRFSALDVAPDGKKLAFVARGHIFALGTASDDAAAQQVASNADAADDLPVWAPDSRRLAYVVDRGRDQAIAVTELPDGVERIVTPPGHHDDYPHWSPDGARLAYVRDGRELHLLDVASQVDRVIARGTLDRRPFGNLGDIAFAPAGDWIAYVDLDDAGFANVRVVRTTGGETHAISFLPNTNAGPLAWAPDGTRLYFTTSQRTEDGQVAQIDLIKRAPHFREDAFRSLFERGPGRNELPGRSPATPESAAPQASPRASAAPERRTTTIDFTDIRERLTLLPTGLDVSAVRATPDGKNLILVAGAVDGENLFSWSVDETSSEPPVAKQLTSTPGRKTSVSVTPTSLYYLDGGTIASAALDGSKMRRVAAAAEFDVDFDHEKRIVFAQAWSLLDRWYADPHFHGADWDAVERAYAPRAAGARTPAELRRVISLMLGELNSSHLGIGGPPTPGVPRWSTGRLGVEWDADTYARTGRLRIAEIVPLGPVALAGGVNVGDEILAVEGTAIGPSDDIDARLANRIGKRTTLRVAPHGDSAAAHTVVVEPIDTPTEQGLLYAAWVAGRRAYVERISHGRLGYVHLLDMSYDSLQKFALDLDVQNRAKAGVVVDIRNNEGGFVDPYAVDILTRREYVRFSSRFGSDSPERTSLGQRALDKPSVLLINEHSLSDAENFTEAYRSLHAGPVVGEPSAGWIIFTDSGPLADGSTIRLPSVRVLDRHGVDLELHPRPVDIEVANSPAADARGDDPQLDAAVRTLLHIAKP